jgi:DNA-binding response OmpR family regulator
VSPGTCLAVAEGFELDLAARQLRHTGKPVHLRPQEFQLLATFAADPGRAFTRRQLMDLAWAPDRPIDLRTVDVHVHWLRAKIEATPSRPTHLVTVRGYGYRLDPSPR